MITFVKSEVNKIQKLLYPCKQEFLDSEKEDKELLEGEDEAQMKENTEAFLKIMLNLLRKNNQEELAAYLQSSERIFLNI